MKWIIIAILFAACVAGGYLFSMKYKKRQSFYSALILFAQKLDVEINFSRERLKNLILSMDEKTKKNLYGIDKNFLTYLDGSSELTGEVLFKNFNLLKPEEKETVFLFFKSLGRSDVLGQSKEIQNFVKRFDESLSKCAQDNKNMEDYVLNLALFLDSFW